MPTVVETFPRTTAPHRSKYETYCDGRVWKFTKADLVELDVSNFETLRNQFYARARAVRGRRARVCVRGDSLYLQTFTNDQVVIDESGSHRPRLAVGG
jgi:hypothetical protein